MMLLVRPALVLLVICGLLTVGALLVGYQSQTVITILTTNTWEGIHVLEVWDILRDSVIRLAGTRCYEAAPVEQQPYLEHQTKDGAEAMALLKC